MDGYLGMIMLWPMSWAPRNWAICNGDLVAIANNEALFSLLGTAFGGDGRVTFALPDLRGRVPVGMGVGPGLHERELGQRGGVEYNQVQLTIDQLPAHTHDLTGTSGVIPASEVDVKIRVSTDEGERPAAQENDYLAQTSQVMGKDVKLYRGDATNSVNISGGTGTIPGQTIDITGNVAPTGHGDTIQVPAMQPYLGMNYIICVIGTYPQRP